MSGKKYVYLRKITAAAVLGLLICLSGACQSGSAKRDSLAADGQNRFYRDLTNSEKMTLNSLVQVDDYPLYTMVYQGDYTSAREETITLPLYREERAWACSLFAVFANSEDQLFGRNFDWDFSPALLLFTDPADGYASVSMVDLYYLGYEDERAFGITDLPLEERVNLLDAPLLPFDGMNEAGLIVGMAAVPDGGIEPDPEKVTVDSVMVIRMILDQAATIEEAVEIISEVNIDMGGNYLHYLIAEESGRSALVEFSEGELVVHNNMEDWQLATNFLIAEVEGDPRAHCWRYDLISRKLGEMVGRISAEQAMDLLEKVAQDHTQWSVVYRGSAREIWIVMGGDFDQIYQIKFDK